MSPSATQAWILASRPQTLMVSVAPVLLGAALASEVASLDLAVLAAAMLGAICIQIGTNLFNDYADFGKGADGEDRLGPPRACANGWLEPRKVLAAVWLCFAIATAAGLYLTWVAGWPVVAIGVASILSGMAYTGGPWPLAYHGLGDLFVFIFFGLVAVAATFYVQVGCVAPDALSAGAAVGLLAANILVANNYRDAETDATAGKRTLVVRFGRRFALWQYGLSALVALLCPPALLLAGYRWPILLPLVLAPWAMRLTHRLGNSTDPEEQIAILGGTARLLAAFGGLLAAGAVISASS